MTQTASPADARLHVAVVGGGITGLALAAGLQARGVRFTVYERAPSLRDIGAGIGLSPNAERALAALSEGALAAFKAVAMPNGEDYFQWVDGRRSGEVMYRLWVGEGMFQGCRRADFVEELGRLVEPGCLKFGKNCQAIAEEADGGVVMTFSDGSTARADVVVGCDGIRSRVRQLMLGQDNPASYPGYSNKFCFRSLVPMDRAVTALGEYRTSTRFMYNGPNAHVITYPVAQGTVLNVLAVITDPNPWAQKSVAANGDTLGQQQHIAPGARSEVETAFAEWHPVVRSIVTLLPEQMDKWAIFDMLDHPAPSYISAPGGVARVCLAGDAAHAAGPHLGAGAGFGIEDALVLAELFAAVDSAAFATADERKGRSPSWMTQLCSAALEAYDDVRYERTQWLVGATREACDLFQWRGAECGSDAEKFGREITWRFHKIWEYDIGEMVRGSLECFTARLEGEELN